MDKQKIAYLNTGILFSHKKEWSSDTCYHLDEPGRHFPKGNKLDTKDQVVYSYDFIYIRYIE